MITVEPTDMYVPSLNESYTSSPENEAPATNGTCVGGGTIVGEMFVDDVCWHTYKQATQA